jgi:hypothetical protein
MLLYADDMVVLAYNVFDLQGKIDVIRKYLAKNDLTVNLSKAKRVIFRIGNAKFSKPTFFWGDEEIDIVEKYVYLGVPMYRIMSYGNVCNFFTSKALQAQRDLFSLFFRAKISNLDVRLHLYESLVKTVLFYCSHIWGVSQLDKIRLFQMQFMRRRFCLPKYTPHWFLMLESQSKPIELCFLKNLLFFCSKIMCRPKESLISKCYDYLRSTSSKANMKLNWFREVSNILKLYDCEDILDAEESIGLENFSISAVRSLILHKIENAKNSIVQSLIIQMQNSKKNTVYKNIRTHCTTDPIMNSNCSWNIVCFYVQLKSSIPRVCIKNRASNLNAVNTYFGQVDDG